MPNLKRARTAQDSASTKPHGGRRTKATQPTQPTRPTQRGTLRPLLANPNTLPPAASTELGGDHTYHGYTKYMPYICMA